MSSGISLEDFQRFQQQLIELKQSRYELESKEKAVRLELDKFKKENHVLQIESSKYKEEAIKLNNTINKSKDKKKVLDLENDLTALKNETEQLRRTLARQRDDFDKEKAELLDELERKREEFFRARAGIDLAPASDLQARVDELQRENSYLQSKIEAIIANANVANGEHGNGEMSTKALETQLNLAQAELSAFRKEREQRDVGDAARVKTMRAEFDRLQKEKEIAAGEAEAANTRLQMTMDQVRRLQSEIEDIQVAKQRIEQNALTLGEKVSPLESQLFQSKQDLTAANSQVSALQGKLVEIQQKAIAALQAKDAEIQRLQQQTQHPAPATGGEIEIARKQVEDIKAKAIAALQERELRIQNLQAALQQAQAGTVGGGAEVAEQLKHLSELQVKNTELTSKLESATSKAALADKLQEDLQIARKQVEDIKAKAIAAIQERDHRLQAALQQSAPSTVGKEGEVNELTTKLREAAEREAALKQQLREVEKQHTEIISTLESSTQLQADVLGKAAEVNRLSSMCIDLEKQVADQKTLVRELQKERDERHKAAESASSQICTLQASLHEKQQELVTIREQLVASQSHGSEAETALRHKITEMETELRELHVHRKESLALGERVQNFEKQIVDLESQLSSEREAALIRSAKLQEEYESALQDLRKQVEELSSHIVSERAAGLEAAEALRSQLTSMSTEVERLTSSSSETEKALEEVSAQFDSEKARLNSLLSTSLNSEATLTEKIKALEVANAEQISRALAEQADVTKSSTFLQGQLSSMVGEVDRLSQVNGNLEKALSDKVAAIEAMRAEMDAIQEERDRQRDAAEIVQGQLRAVQSQLVTSQSEIERLREASTRMEQELAVVREQLKNAHSLNATGQTQRDELLMAKNGLERSLAEAQEEVKKLTISAQSLSATVRDKETALFQIGKDLEAVTADLHKARDDRDAAHAEAVQLTGQLSTLQSQLTASQAQASSLSSRCEQLEQLLQTSSTSAVAEGVGEGDKEKEYLKSCADRLTAENTSLQERLTAADTKVAELEKSYRGEMDALKKEGESWKSKWDRKQASFAQLLGEVNADRQKFADSMKRHQAEKAELVQQDLLKKQELEAKSHQLSTALAEIEALNLSALQLQEEKAQIEEDLRAREEQLSAMQAGKEALQAVLDVVQGNVAQTGAARELAEAELRDSAEKVLSMQTQVSELRQRLEEEQARSNEREAKCRKIEGQLDEAQKQLHDVSEEARTRFAEQQLSADALHAQYKQKLEEVEKRTGDMSAQVEEERRRVSESVAERHRLIEELRSVGERSRKDVEEAQKEVEEWKQKYADVQGTLMTMGQKQSGLQESLMQAQESEKQVAKMRTEIEQLRTMKTQADLDIETLTEKNLLNQSIVSEKLDQIELLQNERDGLTEQLDQAQALIDAKDVIVQQSKSDLEMILKERDSCKERLQVAEDRVRVLEAQVASIQSEVRDVGARRGALEQSAEQMRGDLEKILKDRDTWKEECQSNADRVRVLQTQLSAAVVEMSESSSRREQMEAALMAAASEKRALEGQVADLKSERDRLTSTLASTSQELESVRKDSAVKVKEYAVMLDRVKSEWEKRCKEIEAQSAKGLEAARKESASHVAEARKEGERQLGEAKKEAARLQDERDKAASAKLSQADDDRKAQLKEQKEKLNAEMAEKLKVVQQKFEEARKKAADDVTKLEGDVKRLTDERNKAIDGIKKAAEDMQAVTAKLAKREKESEELRTKLETAEIRSNAATKSLAEVDKERTALQAALHIAEDRASTLLRERDDNAKKILSLETGLAELRNNLENRTSEVQKMWSNMQSANDRCSQAEAQMRKMEDTLSDSQRARQELSDANTHLTSNLNSAMADLQSVKASLERCKEELSASEKQYSDLKGQLSAEIASKDDAVKQLAAANDALQAARHECAERLAQVEGKSKELEDAQVAYKIQEKKNGQLVKELKNQLQKHMGGAGGSVSGGMTMSNSSSSSSLSNNTTSTATSSSKQPDASLHRRTASLTPVPQSPRGYDTPRTSIDENERGGAMGPPPSPGPASYRASPVPVFSSGGGGGEVYSNDTKLLIKQLSEIQSANRRNEDKVKQLESSVTMLTSQIEKKDALLRHYIDTYEASGTVMPSPFSSGATSMNSSFEKKKSFGIFGVKKDDKSDVEKQRETVFQETLMKFINLQGEFNSLSEKLSQYKKKFGEL